MKHNVGDIWKEAYGANFVYRVQFPNGVMTFKTLKLARVWSNQLKKDIKEVG